MRPKNCEVFNEGTFEIDKFGRSLQCHKKVIFEEFAVKIC